MFVPGIDIAGSGFFASGVDGFPLRSSFALHVVNDGVLWCARIVLVTLVVAIAVGVFHRWPYSRIRPVMFLLVVYVIGAGLVVNELLKDGMGRARPAHLAMFGGDRSFTPAFVPSTECASNCSFTSGHVAFAAMPIAGWFLAGYRMRALWLAGGLLFASTVGYARIAVGAHFLSDVVFSIFFMWLVMALSAFALLGRRASRLEPVPHARAVPARQPT